ncbi:MAG: two-component system response regulator [Bdellovibrionia bacterium]
MKQKSIVLFIEDDDQLRETVQMIIESTGRDAWLARNGREAIELLGRQKDVLPDLIILDMMMPEMGGAEFLEKKSLDPRIGPIPVIVATAVRSLQFPEGAVKLRHKPFELQELIEDMDALCP